MSPEYKLSWGLFLAYIALYTAYDKKTKTLKPSLLFNIMLLQGEGGYTHTLKELNKVLALNGLTVLLLSFANLQNYNKNELFRISVFALLVHSLYSFYEFYGFSINAVLKDKLLKPTSIVLGVLCQLLINMAYFTNTVPFSVLALEATVLGVLHFWMYEVDYKYVLQIRPFAYLPFIIGGYVFILHCCEVFSIKGLF